MADARISTNNRQPDTQKGFVLYWMQQSQRVEGNHALNHAIRLSNSLQKPLYVVFVLSDAVPAANLRHYQFMLEGLLQTAHKLGRINISLHILAGKPDQVLARIADQAAAVVTDSGYLRWQREWRSNLQTQLTSSEYCEVESDVIVPVRSVSAKEEYAAATIRGKILKLLPDYLLSETLPDYTVKAPAQLHIPSDIPHLQIQNALQFSDLLHFANAHLHIDSSVQPVKSFQGGYQEARKRLDLFLEQRLHLYADKRNDPPLQIQSELSPFLHFGQISALEVALAVLNYCAIPAYAVPDLMRNKAGLTSLQAGASAFLEELIIRRELSCNFCFYNENYDNYACIPLWARKTLNDHLADARPYLYTPGQLENAETADPYWNAAQKEMLLTGKMHNYMRMYWGKKIIEWSPDPETAFQVMPWLNNKYNLDGRDPNSFAGIAWCFGKHDRPWQSREIFGSVRYMNSNGLKRKFDMQGYLDRIAQLIL